VSYALTDILPSYIDPPSRTRDADDSECEPWSTTQPSWCGRHSDGILCQECDAGCAGDELRAIVWFERQVRGNVPGEEGKRTTQVYSLRLCADCVAEHGDELEQCTACGEYYHVDVGGLTASHICHFCDQKAVCCG